MISPEQKVKGLVFYTEEWRKSPVQKEEGYVGEDVENLGTTAQNVKRKCGANRRWAHSMPLTPPTSKHQL
jgi:hypothetical protein